MRALTGAAEVAARRRAQARIVAAHVGRRRAIAVACSLLFVLVVTVLVLLADRARRPVVASTPAPTHRIAADMEHDTQAVLLVLVGGLALVVVALGATLVGLARYSRSYHHTSSKWSPSAAFTRPAHQWRTSLAKPPATPVVIMTKAPVAAKQPAPRRTRLIARLTAR